MKTLCRICGRNATLFCRKEKFSYYQCKYCKTLFLYPQPTQRETLKYYSDQFEYPAGKTNEELIRKRSNIVLRKLRRLNPRGKILLDVGTGYGYFLKEAIENGMDCVGLEPSKELYTLLRNKSRFTILNTTIQGYLNQAKTHRFDFITLIHTIEHLNDPKNILMNIAALLNPGGILFLETPNLDSHLFWAEKDRYTFLTPPDHLWIFSSKSFDFMTKEISSLTLRKTGTYSYPEHAMGIVKSILKRKLRYSTPTKTTKNSSLAKQAKIALFDRLLAKLATPFLNIGNKGSILEIYAQKR